MNYQIVTDTKKNRALKLEDDLTVANSVEIKSLLKKLFEGDGNISIDHSSASSFDFAYVQLLAAFRIECEHIGKQVSFSDTTPQELTNAVVDSGFVKHFDFFTKKMSRDNE